MINIEKNIPIPSYKTKNLKIDFNELDINDSFFISGATSKSSVVSSARQYGKKTKKKFLSRVISENGINGVRIWRVK